MTVSDVHEGDVITIEGKKAIVVVRNPSDRRAGTTVQFENGACETYWDRHPEVVLVGRGRLVSNIVMDPVHLFQEGAFVLRSGKKSKYKIECDSLGERDWAGIAAAVMEEKLLPHPFSVAVGVPRGGNPFAAAMKLYATIGCDNLLVCEDIVTTGGSIERFLTDNVVRDGWRNVMGVCFIARGKCPEWITPLLQMTTRQNA